MFILVFLFASLLQGAELDGFELSSRRPSNPLLEIPVLEIPVLGSTERDANKLLSAGTTIEMPSVSQQPATDLSSWKRVRDRFRFPQDKKRLACIIIGCASFSAFVAYKWWKAITATDPHPFFKSECGDGVWNRHNSSISNHKPMFSADARMFSAESVPDNSEFIDALCLLVNPWRTNKTLCELQTAVLVLATRYMEFGQQCSIKFWKAPNTSVAIPMFCQSFSGNVLDGGGRSMPGCSLLVGPGAPMANGAVVIIKDPRGRTAEIDAPAKQWVPVLTTPVPPQRPHTKTIPKRRKLGTGSPSPSMSQEITGTGTGSRLISPTNSEEDISLTWSKSRRTLSASARQTLSRSLFETQTNTINEEPPFFYWGDSAGTYAAAINLTSGQSGPRRILSLDLAPHGLFVDRLQGRFYGGKQGGISVANINSADPKPLSNITMLSGINQGSEYITGISVLQNRIYWMTFSNALYTGLLDSSNVTDITRVTLPTLPTGWGPYTFTLDNEKIYVVDTNGGLSVGRFNDSTSITNMMQVCPSKGQVLGAWLSRAEEDLSWSMSTPFDYFGSQLSLTFSSRSNSSGANCLPLVGVNIVFLSWCPSGTPSSPCAGAYGYRTVHMSPSNN